MFLAWQWDIKWTSVSWNWSLWWFSTYWPWHRCFKSKWGWHCLYRRNRKNSFLPIPDCQLKEAQAIQQHLYHKPDHITRPTVGREPINEYITPFLATLAFPTMFPDACSDPTNPALSWDLSFAERVKHLIKFGGKKGTQWVYRFATHPRFAYWAFNMTQRNCILQQTGIFLKQNPGEAHLTTEEITQMASTNNIGTFTSKVSGYLGNISGSDAYWQKAKEDLKAVTSHDGLPKFFFTFSSADMHWPELHALFGRSSEKFAITWM